MKKIISFVLCVALLFTFSLSAFASGNDDGKLIVANKGDVRYLGEANSEGFVKYVAANGNGTVFYDINGDKDMNICDLVALVNNQIDFDLGGTYNSSDSDALRSFLLESSI